MRKEVLLILVGKTGDRGQTPVGVRLIERGCVDLLLVQRVPQVLQRSRIASRQVNQGRVFWKIVSTSVLDSSMRRLNGLVSDWEIAARDDVQLREVLGLHDVLTIE